MPILRQSRPPHSRSTPTLRPAGLPTIRWTGRRSYLNPQRTVTNCLYLGGRVLAGDDSSVATPPRGRGTNHVISGDLGVGDIGVESVDCEHSACHGLVRVPGGLFPIRVIRAKSPIEHYDAAETALAADLAMVTNGSCTVVIQPPRCVADAEIALWFAAIGRSGTGCTPETLRDRRFRAAAAPARMARPRPSMRIRARFIVPPLCFSLNLGQFPRSTSRVHWHSKFARRSRWTPRRHSQRTRRVP